MPRLQIHHEHAFLEQDVTLPPLQREDRTAQNLFSTFRPQSYCSPPRDKEKETVASKEWEQDGSLSKTWQNPDSIQRRHRSATTRQRMDSENKDFDIFMENIFPMKAVCHKRAFHLNNCQAGNDYFTQKDQKRLDYPFHCTSQDKHTINRREGKNYLSKLEPFDKEHSQSSWKRDESNGKSIKGNKILFENQYILPESQIRMTKEIHRKEIILQEKLLKAEEIVRKMCLGDKSKIQDWNKNADKAANRLHSTEKGNWDWESTRERAIEGRREEQERERVREWGRGNKDDTARWEKQMLTDDTYRDRRKEATEWENRRRPIEYEIQKKEWDNYEDMTKQKGQRMEKDKSRRDRSVEWIRNEMKEWHIRAWQKERVTGGKRTSEKAKSNRDTEKTSEEDLWKKSNSHVKVKASSKHDKRNEFILDQWPQETLQLHRRRFADEPSGSMTKGLREPPIEALQTPSLKQKSTRIRQVELSPKRNSDAQVQLVPCEICHRCFVKDRLERHTQVCETQQQSRRKTFDSAQFRAKGTDLEKFMKTNSRSKTPELKNNWRQKHEALIHNLRQARAPAPGGYQLQPSLDVNPDYVSCPHCGRRFAPRPAERHIPKCQNIKSRPPPPRQRH